VSHNRDQIIINRLLPIFSEPAVRERMAPHQCARVDSIVSQSTFTDGDVRYLLAALGTILAE
jgi:hypothetical protein